MGDEISTGYVLEVLEGKVRCVESPWRDGESEIYTDRHVRYGEEVTEVFETEGPAKFSLRCRAVPVTDLFPVTRPRSLLDVLRSIYPSRYPSD